MSYLSDLLGTAYKEGMTEEEISSAIEPIIRSHTASEDKLKKRMSEINSENAGYKKKLTEHLSEEEKKAAETAELIKTLQEENKAIKRSQTIAEHKATLIAMGYDEALAVESATAVADGDMAKYLENQGKFNEKQKQSILAEALKNTPKPKTGDAPGGKSPDAEEYSKKMRECLANGNYADAAYYSRLVQQGAKAKDID